MKSEHECGMNYSLKAAQSSILQSIYQSDLSLTKPIHFYIPWNINLDVCFSDDADENIGHSNFTRQNSLVSEKRKDVNVYVLVDFVNILSCGSIIFHGRMFLSAVFSWKSILVNRYTEKRCPNIWRLKYISLNEMFFLYL